MSFQGRQGCTFPGACIEACTVGAVCMVSVNSVQSFSSTRSSIHAELCIIDVYHIHAGNHLFHSFAGTYIAVT